MVFSLPLPSSFFKLSIVFQPLTSFLFSPGQLDLRPVNCLSLTFAERTGEGHDTAAHSAVDVYLHQLDVATDLGIAADSQTTVR